MNARHEDDAWRAIVENYGERVRLDDEDEVASDPTEGPGVDEASSAPGHSAPPAGTPEGFTPFEGTVEEPRNRPDPRAEDEGRFVPPRPDLPRVAPRRLVAWLALALGPLTLLVAALSDQQVSSAVALGLALCFVGGFCYLVLTMSNEPRDPWDDGSRV